jgi:type I restriction enzyme, S subunit
VNQHIALVRVAHSKANCRWVAHYLSGTRAQALIRRFDDQGAKAGLNLPSVRGFPLAQPPRPEQDEIAARLDAADAAIAAEEQYLRKLSLMKAGLVTDLVTGRVTVAPIREAVAS